MNKQTDPALIKAYQENLISLNFDLGRWGADGALGTITKNVSHDAAKKFSLPAPVGWEIPDALVVGISNIVAQKKSSPVAKPPNFHDLTERAYTGPRDHRVPIGSWEGATIHQTGAAPFGRSNWTLEQLFERWANASFKDKDGVIRKSSLKAHIGICRDGKILLIHPLEWFVWHAQRQSLTHVGFEVEAFACGILGDLSTKPNGQDTILEATDIQLEQTINAVMWVDAVIRFYGGKGLKYINGHRNADNDRRADPGSRIYKGVVLPLLKMLGLSDQGPSYKTGDGLLTPEAWNPAYVGNKY